VRIARSDERIVASVEDDGAGFDLAAREADDPCLGLFGMRERALYAGGWTSITSTAGRGTRVEVVLPLAEGSRAERATLEIVPRPMALTD
jgi:two-component system, NarL family, sensor histidine kinase NreB